MNRGVRYFLPGGINDEDDANKVSSFLTIVTIGTFTYQYTRKYIPLYYYSSTYLLLEEDSCFIWFLWYYYYSINSIQGAFSWEMGCWEHVIPESWLDFVRDCFRTIMNCHAKLKMTPRPFNMMFNEILYFILYFRTQAEGYFKKWNQDLYCPARHLVRDGPRRRLKWRFSPTFFLWGRAGPDISQDRKRGRIFMIDTRGILQYTRLR